MLPEQSPEARSVFRHPLLYTSGFLVVALFYHADSRRWRGQQQDGQGHRAGPLGKFKLILPLRSPAIGGSLGLFALDKDRAVVE